MAEIAGRIPTTHTGSLPRPAGVLEMVRDRHADPVECAALVRDAVAEVVTRQIDVGIDIVGDGEMSKTSFFQYLGVRLDGLEMGEGLPFLPADILAFPEYARAWPRCSTTATTVTKTNT